jgi:hypothetical protein
VGEYREVRPHDVRLLRAWRDGTLTPKQMTISEREMVWALVLREENIRNLTTTSPPSIIAPLQLIAARSAVDYDPSKPGIDQRPPTFERELESLINRYSQENGSNTPDFILAQYLLRCLEAWNDGITRREQWYGRSGTVPATIEQQEQLNRKP